ncbi:hypothetical protein ACJJI4_11560 [Microbulbifer sp. TRSA002]|uniref:hypothetical protein n=1 Tax=Microbulbifer sp. TRSA002 TaxID=3243382 RepID=UPI004039E1FC
MFVVLCVLLGAGARSNSVGAGLSTGAVAGVVTRFSGAICLGGSLVGPALERLPDGPDGVAASQTRPGQTRIALNVGDGDSAAGWRQGL